MATVTPSDVDSRSADRRPLSTAGTSSRRTDGSGSRRFREIIQHSGKRRREGAVGESAPPPPPGRLLVRAATARPGSCCTTCGRARRPTGATPVGSHLGASARRQPLARRRVDPQLLGVAHGFAAADRHDRSPYLVDGYYNPAMGVAWDDPAIVTSRSHPVGAGPGQPPRADIEPQRQPHLARAPDRIPERSAAMKLFVTGAAGFIGSNYVRHVLATTDDEVTVYDALLRREPLQPGRRRRRPPLLVRAR